MNIYETKLSDSFCFFCFSLFIQLYQQQHKSKGITETKIPEFVDNGKTIDSLKKVYDCENIEFNNWEVSKAEDSCLNVCLINSTKISSILNLNSDVDLTKEIASAIKKQLVKPAQYNSFYIIFIKKEMVNGEEIKVHTLGSKITSNRL